MVIGGIATTLAKAVVVFISTNIDDIVILSVLFANPQLRGGSVVAGQLLGMAVLVGGSALAGVLAVAIPPGWISLLGAIPLALGLYQGIQLLRRRRDDDDDDEPAKEIKGGSQTLIVAGITIANGGDNVAIYVPVFAADCAAIAIYAAVFALLTAVWCAAGYQLVNNRVFGKRLRRYGHILLPIVLIALGIEILADARALL